MTQRIIWYLKSVFYGVTFKGSKCHVQDILSQYMGFGDNQMFASDVTKWPIIVDIMGHTKNGGDNIVSATYLST